ncbi:serine protease 48-like [Melitaea cinxia]|uniref:serine protease 48-like n=1 Tax=Melitaea cinxia TaxID=113334 RepID=UPI001E27368A|nr:serine protease 48-like [Melitaea cinxia]
MKLFYQYFLITICFLIKVNSIKFYRSVRPKKVFEIAPCPDNSDIVSRFESGLKNGYNITIKKTLSVTTELRLSFDSEAAVLLGDGARFSSTEDNVYNIFKLIVTKEKNDITFIIKGFPAPHSPPYLTSLKINDEENCRRPNLTYFEEFPVGVTKRRNVPDRFCGKRKVLHTELIVSGVSTKAGDWPWHVAIYRQERSTLKYICGGTLISKHIVLTAAHCTTLNGVPVLPDILGVFAGKYYLFRSDITTQELQVHQVIVHDEYSHTTLKNDISLLKLRTEVIFNNYVQPACLWYDEAYDKLTSFDIFGTVVGWGFDRTDSLTTSIHAATIPLIPNLSCILSNPIFYSNAIKDGKKFCAGYNNGTSACNGDSGGGFMVFLPDDLTDNTKKTPGAWYVRGIVSESLSRQDAPICDPYSYTVFTDVSQYLNWIKNNVGT